MKRGSLRLMVVFVVAVLVSAVAALFAFQQIRSVPTEYRAQKEDVEKLLSTYEVREAYEIFKSRYAEVTQAEQHQAAHLFGEALYAKGGIDLFAICDQSFGFGCYHSFISLALKDHGEGVAKDLDAKCVAAYGEQGLGCSHGVGHGLLSFFGYDAAALGKALTLCEEMSWRHPYGGCKDGVFMEYDFQTMAQAEGGSLRSVDSNNPLVPCTTVPQGSRVACYFGLPSLWISSKSTTIPGMEAWCMQIATKNERAACFRGIGYGYPPHVSFSVPKMIGACDEISNREGRLHCREGGAWMLYADPALRDMAAPLCSEGLTEPEAAQCTDGYLFVLQ